MLGWQAGASKWRPRDRWIGWRRREQFLRLHLIANNTHMLVLCLAQHGCLERGSPLHLR